MMAVIHAVAQCMFFPFQKWMIDECHWWNHFVSRATLDLLSLDILTQLLMTCITKPMWGCIWERSCHKQARSECGAHNLVNIILKLVSLFFLFIYMLLKKFLPYVLIDLFHPYLNVAVQKFATLSLSAGANITTVPNIPGPLASCFLASQLKSVSITIWMIFWNSREHAPG